MHTTNAAMSPLVEATCLAHVVEGVSLRLVTAAGRDLLVSYGCLGADLTPCQLRTAVINAAITGGETLWNSIREVGLAGGLAHLGGGLYQRSSATSCVDERWFVSGLPVERLRAVVSNPCPLPFDDDVFGIVLKPDLGLGATAVCVQAPRAAADQLDEVSTWALATVLAAELLHGLEPAADERAAHPTHVHRTRRARG